MRICFFFLLSSLMITSVLAREPITLTYAQVDQEALLLDLYLPERPQGSKLLVWVHGGAWRAGSRKDMPLIQLVDQGWSIASVDYRLSPVAPFPAQVHDIKAAIRYLRVMQPKHGYASERIAIAGSSAGGHLAALVGVTNGHAELEGAVGEHLKESSKVHAIVSLFGMSNLTTILNQSNPFGLNMRVPAIKLLFGGPPEEKTELAKLASPVFHVDAADPPLLLIHGDQDPQVPINQAHELQGRYEALGLPCEFHVIHGGKHGGAEFYDTARLQRISKFLEQAWK